jgi:hypothetical protein
MVPTDFLQDPQLRQGSRAGLYDAIFDSLRALRRSTEAHRAGCLPQ